MGRGAREKMEVGRRGREKMEVGEKGKRKDGSRGERGEKYGGEIDNGRREHKGEVGQDIYG